MNIVILEVFLGMLAVGVIGWAWVEIQNLGKKHGKEDKK